MDTSYQDEEIQNIIDVNLNSGDRLIQDIKSTLHNQNNYNIYTKPDSSNSGKKKREKSKMAANNSRIHMHRPSVRSISETPNIIGATRTQYSYDMCTYFLIGITWFSVVMFFPISFLFIFRVVQEYERGKKKTLSS